MRLFQRLSLPTFQHRKQNDDEDSNNDAFTERKRKALDHGCSFRLPDGLTGHDCLAGPVFFADIDDRCAELSFVAALAGRHAG